jgi:hypothetical protein
MKRLAITMIAGLALVGCAKPPVEGYVIDGEYTPAWIQIIPGSTTCSGNPSTCFTTSAQIIPWPDSWRLKLQNTRSDDRDKTGWREVTQLDYERCNIGERFPDCTDPNVGDAR